METLLGEITLVGFNFAPRNWALCNGELLTINSNQALFSLLGSTYGGDGRATFALPGLQGRMPIGTGDSPAFPPVIWGEQGGDESATLTNAEMPVHTHIATAAYVPGASSPVAVSGTLNVCTETATITSPSAGDYLASAASGGAALPGYIASSSVDNTNQISVGGLNITAFLNGDLPGGSVTVTNQNSGEGVPFSTRNPYLGMHFVIATTGVFPSRN